MFTLSLAFLVSVVPPVLAYWDSGYWDSGYWGSGYWGYDSGYWGYDSGYWGSGMGYEEPDTWVEWFSPPSCSFESCWCNDVHGVKGYHQNIEAKYNTRSDGCTMELYGSHDDHCCRKHDFCYTEAGRTRYSCDRDFCNCVSGINKIMGCTCTVGAFAWNNYRESQRGWTECVYYPPRDKWHLIEIGSGRRRMEEPEAGNGAEEAANPGTGAANGCGAAHGSGAADSSTQADDRDPASLPAMKVAAKLDEAAKKLSKRLQGRNVDGFGLPDHLHELGMDSGSKKEERVDEDDTPIVIHAHYIHEDPHVLHPEIEQDLGNVHHAGNGHQGHNIHHGKGHHGKHHGGSVKVIEADDSEKAVGLDDSEKAIEADDSKH